MSDKSVQLVNPEDNSERQFPITLASLVGTNNNSNVEVELGKKYEKPNGGIPDTDLAGNYKTKQTAVSDPSATGDETDTVISNLSQDTNGVVKPKKKKVKYPTGSKFLFNSSTYDYINAAIKAYITTLHGNNTLALNRNLLFANITDFNLYEEVTLSGVSYHAYNIILDLSTGGIADILRKYKGITFNISIKLLVNNIDAAVQIGRVIRLLHKASDAVMIIHIWIVEF